jgi:hypothetical protein
MPEYAFTFCDLLTGAELAVLPMTGVKLDRALNAAGSFTGFVPVMDPQVRALDPWAATTPRRTAVYAERDGAVVWGGIVWGRRRAAGSLGLALSGATFESWLAHRLLTADLTGTGRTAAQMATTLLATLQAATNGNIGLTVSDATGGAARDRTWLASDTKTALDLISSYTQTQKPIEFRVDVGKDGAGRFTRTLVIGEPKLGRRATASGIELVYPGGELLDWTDAEDGGAANNALYGNGGPPPAGGANLTVYRTAGDVGSNELVAGVPLLQGGFSASNQSSLPALTDAVDAQLLAGLNTQGRWSNAAVRPDGEFGVGGYHLGDDATLRISHPGFREWPADAFADTVRIIGDTLTPGEGNTPESLTWTLGLDGRLAQSVTLTSVLGDLLSRVAAIETI